MPRDLSEVLHYFLPEIDERADAPRPGSPEALETPPPVPSSGALQAKKPDPALPVLFVPCGEQDVVRAALAWSLTVETARLGGRAVMLAPQSDRDSPLWPAPGTGPCGSEFVLRHARDLTDLCEAASALATEHSSPDDRGGIVFVATPPNWLEESAAPAMQPRWMLALSSARPADIEDFIEQAGRILAKHPQASLGLTLLGVSTGAEARKVHEALTPRAKAAHGQIPKPYGLVVDDLHLYRAITAQRPVGIAYPQAPVTRALREVAGLLYQDARSRIHA